MSLAQLALAMLFSKSAETQLAVSCSKKRSMWFICGICLVAGNAANPRNTIFRNESYRKSMGKSHSNVSKKRFGQVQ